MTYIAQAIGVALDKQFKTLEEVAKAAEAALAAKSGAERRRFPRTPIKGVLRAELYVNESLRGIAQLRDLSRGGIGIYSSVALQRDEEFVLNVKVASDECVRMTCCTKRCDPDKSGDQYAVGAELREVVKLQCNGRCTPSVNDALFESPAATSDGDREHISQVQQLLAEFTAE